VTGGHVEAVARLLHRGRTVLVVDTELRDADGRPVARTTQTQAVLRPAPRCHLAGSTAGPYRP
jgi:1,4-dihydroxy-2-naphthoyl-CoA hydrolase